MDYSRGKFGDCSFSRFNWFYRANKQTNRQTQKQTDANERYTPTTLCRDAGLKVYSIYQH